MQARTRFVVGMFWIAVVFSCGVGALTSLTTTLIRLAEGRLLSTLGADAIVLYTVGGAAVGIVAGAVPAGLSAWAARSRHAGLAIAAAVLSSLGLAAPIWLWLSTGPLSAVDASVFWSLWAAGTAVAAWGWWRAARLESGDMPRG